MSVASQSWLPALGLTGRPRRRLLALAALIWVALAAISLTRAVSEARAGQRAGLAAVHLVRGDAANGHPTELRDVVAQLRRARARLAEANRLAGRPSLFPFRFLPVLGRQLRSFQALTDAGADISDISADAAARADVLFEPEDTQGRDTAGLLRQVADLARRTDESLARVGFGPGEGLLNALASSRDDLMERAAELRTDLRRGARGADTAASILDGRRRYLVLAANNAEMRAGSGMFLSAGLLRIDDGRLSMSAFRHTDELALPPGAVPLEGHLAARWDWLKPNQEWRNLGVSPRFDVTASLAAEMWVATGGEPVDGVLAVDPVALEAILAVVGPVEVAGRRFSADNVVDWILHDQYVEYAADPLQAARREQLGQIAHAVVDALEQRDWRPDRLGVRLARAARGRHLLAWSSRREEQGGWLMAGVDGGLDPSSLLVAVLNRGGNKLDRFLEVSADLRLDSRSSVRQGELHLHLRNTVPRGEPAYVAGPEKNSGANEGDYVGLVAVSLPEAARDIRVEGVAGLAVAGRDGPTWVVASAVRLARGDERSVVVRFSLPGGSGSLTIEPSARRPGIDWTADGRSFPDGSRHTVAW